MLLISTTHKPATDLGFLLHKNPDRCFETELSFGKAHVVYPEASEDKATAALLLEIDSVGLVRGGQAQGALAHYVNDRPYVANSYLSVAIAQVYGSALSGRSKERPDLAETPIPLEIRIPLLASREGSERIRSLFVPLGFDVRCQPVLVGTSDESAPVYFDVSLQANIRLSDALKHLYILVPALDEKKHYFVDESELEKLMKKGEGWLQAHPHKDWIARRYLKRKRSLLRQALEQLSNAEDGLAVDESRPERPPTLHRQRHERVLELIQQIKPESVIDLGCGSGALLREIVRLQGISRVAGMDISHLSLTRASQKLFLQDASPAYRERVELIHGSLLYRDNRLKGFDLATVVEVIEHLDPPRLRAFEHNVFGEAAPDTVLLTTPNSEYNTVFSDAGFRHKDHRFEWSRAEFAEWASNVAERYGYRVEIEGVGEAHEEYGSPSQLGVFRK